MTDVIFAVVVPGFPGGEESPTPKVGVPGLLFGQFSHKNCMKIKEIGPRRGHLNPLLICQQ